jgi:hypothetical protein
VVCIGDDEYTCINGELVKTGIGACAIGPPPGDEVTFVFDEPGYSWRRLPDSYGGVVYLNSLLDIPIEVQGVYWCPGDIIWVEDPGGGHEECTEPMLFWSPGAPGNTLEAMMAMERYYISVIGPCSWTIPLP